MLANLSIVTITTMATTRGQQLLKMASNDIGVQKSFIMAINNGELLVILIKTTTMNHHHEDYRNHEQQHQSDFWI